MVLVLRCKTRMRSGANVAWGLVWMAPTASAGPPGFRGKADRVGAPPQGHRPIDRSI